MKLVSPILAAWLALAPVAVLAQTPAGGAQGGSAIGGGPQPMLNNPVTTNPVATEERTPAEAAP